MKIRRKHGGMGDGEGGVRLPLTSISFSRIHQRSDQSTLNLGFIPECGIFLTKHISTKDPQLFNLLNKIFYTTI